MKKLAIIALFAAGLAVTSLCQAEQKEIHIYTHYKFNGKALITKDMVPDNPSLVGKYGDSITPETKIKITRTESPTDFINLLDFFQSFLRFLII